MAIVISARKLGDLLIEADPEQNLQVRVLSTGRLALGLDTQHPTKIIDLSREEIVSGAAANDAKAPEPTQPELKPPVVERRFHQSGKYYIDFRGEIIPCRSLKEALAAGLKAIEQDKPGTLQKLTTVKPRSKRIVARSPSDLFEGQKELVENYSEQLTNGWWIGTNNSAAETKSWLRRACDLAELRWDKDFSASW